MVSDKDWTVGESLGTVSMAFTPAVVGPRCIAQPHRLTTGYELAIGNWKVAFKARLGMHPPGLIFLMDSLSNTPPEP